jgi:hypothetical protein
MILLPFWFDISLVHIGKLLDIGKTVDEKGIFSVELMTVHLVEGVSGRVGISEFNKGISMRARLYKIRRRMWVEIYPLLSPVLSFHGTEISSGFIATPLRVNSFAIFVKSFSSFDLSMTGTPSTTRMLSKPSSRRTWYLYETY